MAAETAAQRGIIRLAEDGAVHARACAKVNLYLHVLGRRADGYHNLESLVTFADIGDDLSLMPDHALSLEVDGPFAAQLAGEGDNLILKAARLFCAAVPGAVAGRFRLTKRLPVASGIGGGSSDAAAALRLLAFIHAIPVTDARIMACAAALGADVPVCLEAEPRFMRGIGHDLGPALTLGFDQPVLLVNPAVPVSSREAFAALGLRAGESLEGEKTGHSGAGVPILGMLSRTRNDLEAAAIYLAPAVGETLMALRALPTCRFARMSGSGATCFALFDTPADAQQAADHLKTSHPDWWIEAGRLKMPF